MISNSRTLVLLSGILLLSLSGLVISHQTHSPAPDISESEVVRSAPRPDYGLVLIEREGRFTARLADAPLPAVVAQLARITDMNISLDDRLQEKRIDLKLVDASLEELIAALSGSSASVLERRGDEVRMISTLLTAEVDDVDVETTAATATELDATGTLAAAADESAPRYIMLRNARIDGHAPPANPADLGIPPGFEASEDTEMYIVQFARLIDAELRSAIEEVGATVLHYVPESAYAVRIAPDKLDALRGMADVQHVEPYHPYFKMSGAVRAFMTADKVPADVQEQIDRGQFNMVMFRGMPGDPITSLPGVSVVEQVELDGRRVVTIESSAEQLMDILRVDDVQWLEPVPQNRVMNDTAAYNTRVNSLRQAHPTLDGQGVIVSVADTGIDFRNPNFAIDDTLPTSTNLNTRIVHYSFAPSVTSDGLPGDTDGHGTHVAGSIFGSGALSETVNLAPGAMAGDAGPYMDRDFKGMAPSARAVIIEDFNSFTDLQMAEISYAHGARIMNNSWGNTVYEYGAMSMIWDALVRDAMPGVPGNQELITFFAAGNQGEGNYGGLGGQAGTIGQPANAKNIIAVGAMEQKRFADNLANVNIMDMAGNLVRRLQSVEMTDTDWQVAYFSSRGPVTTEDRRVKPDIMAPGAYVLSVLSHEAPDFSVLRGNPPVLNRDYRSGNIDSGTNYAFFSGTSMATPVAAGAAALFYQNFTNTFNRAPSAAMTKAALIGGARMLNSVAYKFPMFPQQIEIVDQGWGKVDIRRTVDGARMRDTDQVILLDQMDTTPLQTGQFFTYPITVGPEHGGMKIVLAWTDRPGTPGNERQLINDLDLLVQAPGPGGFRGNIFSGDGVHSMHLINMAGVAGDRFNNVEVVVIPETISGTYTIQVYGHQVPEGPQDFALAIMTGIGTENRHEGRAPAIDLDEDDSPVLAYSEQVGLNRQIMVKRWLGEFGDLSDLDRWKRYDGQWQSVAGSGLGSGISQSLGDSENPAIAVHGDQIFVAWEQAPNIQFPQRRIHFMAFDGQQWRELGNSASGWGLSGEANYDALDPQVAVLDNGRPVVSWRRRVEPAGDRVYVTRWTGSQWSGFANSHVNGVPFNGNANTASVRTPRLIVDTLDRPVVAWSDPNQVNTYPLQIRRWNGSAWQALSTLGGSPSTVQPYIASANNGRLLVTWVQQTGGFHGGLNNYQVFAAIGSSATATTFTPLSGSTTFPGISSSTNSAAGFPRWPTISGGNANNVLVAWLEGTTNELENVVRVRQHTGSGWVNYEGAGVAPGVDRLSGHHNTLEMRRTTDGLPVLAFEHAFQLNTLEDAGEDDWVQESLVYSVVKDVIPPKFAGLASATGGTNQNIVLRWAPAKDNITPEDQIIYRIYRVSTGTDAWDLPQCTDAIFNTTPIASVTGTNRFEDTGRTPYQHYCYAVRAEDAAGNRDDNTVIRFAFPKIVDEDGNIVEADQIDTTGTGLPDWWEFLHFPGGFAQNLNDTVGPAGALTVLEAYLWGTDPFSADSDGDGLSDRDEVDLHGTHPAVADTDGDGLPDGLEVELGSDPLAWDSGTMNQVPDGDRYQLGFDDPSLATDGLLIHFEDSFDPPVGGWITTQVLNAAYPVNYWHLSTAEPKPVTAVETTTVVRLDGTTTNHVRTWISGPPQRMSSRANDQAFRFANDPSASSPTSTYSPPTAQLIQAVLVSPEFTPTNSHNLFLRWREYLDTEPGRDFVSVQARSDSTDWQVVSGQRSGRSEGWQIKTADLSALAGQTNVQVRFLFTADAVNNHFTGWYIDEVQVYEGAQVGGWVRNIHGRPVANATVSAIGRGGLTNVVNGHQVVELSQEFGTTKTADDGSFLIRGLPFGEYYFKAEAIGHGTEFYDGPLFTAYEFGGLDNPGVPEFEIISAGAVALSAANLQEYVHFELEPGDNRAYLGVAHAGPSALAAINYSAVAVWDGGTALQNYTTRSSLNDLTNSSPSWPVGPAANLVDSLMPGRHRVSAAVTQSWRVPQPLATVRDGQVSRFNVVTDTGRGYIQVVAQAAGTHRVYLNGIDTGINAGAPVTALSVQAGRYLVSLGSASAGIPAQVVDVPIGGRANVLFTAAQINGPTGAIKLSVVDRHLNALSNVTLRMNGQVHGSSLQSPLLIDGLRQGTHEVSVTSTGFRQPEPRLLQVVPGETNTLQYVLDQSDLDYDGLGDFYEISTFGNGATLSGIFQQSGDDHYVANGVTNDLSNRLKFEMGRQYGIHLNPLVADTDGDGLKDGAEIGYSGQTNIGTHILFALSSLTDPAPKAAGQVQMHFVGRFLEGVHNFGGTNALPIIAAIDGDRFEVNSITNINPGVTATNSTLAGVQTVLGGIAPTTLPVNGVKFVSRSIDHSHPTGASVYADTMPHLPDTSGDGMWDGFKAMYSTFTLPNTATTVQILDPLEAGGGDDDPDMDGLTNLQEFMIGTDPTNPDTDGDGMPDGWEVFYGLDPLDPADAEQDLSGDGLINRLEYQYGTNPTIQDTDGDGLTDFQEIFGVLNQQYREDAFFPEHPGSTDPLNPDTDGDGLSDGFEVLVLGSNPNRWDTSGDGMSDGFAVLDAFGNLRPEHQWLDPTDPGAGAADASGDGMTNLENFLVRDSLGQFGKAPEGVVWDYWLNPFSTDSDGDGMPDVFEVYYGLHPMDPIPVAQGTVTRYPELGPTGDPDEDGLWNIREYTIRFLLDPDADPFAMPGLSTDPRNPDTDGDGVYDGHEWHSFSSNPLETDTDGDGLRDGSEIGVWGEVRSPRSHYQRYEFVDVIGNQNWTNAAMQAMMTPHPLNSNVFAHLATFDNRVQFLAVVSNIVEQVGTNVSGVAVGAFFDPLFIDNGVTNFLSEVRFEWVDGMPFYDYFGDPIFPPVDLNDLLGGDVDVEEDPPEADPDPDLPPAPETDVGVGIFTGTNLLALVFDTDNPLAWYAVDAHTSVVEYALIEWPHPDTFHYDSATNDLWVFSWPSDAGKGFPIWRQITPDSDELPPPRWGHAASYIPGFENKNPDGTRYDPGAMLLLDNRKLVVLGGRDGQDRKRDIWEYWIHSNVWKKSRVTLPEMGLFSRYSRGYRDGASEWHAAPLMGYSDTRSMICPCIDVPWNCTGEEFGEPKSRPWNYGYQRSSFDWIYLFGGWNEHNEYLFPDPMEHFVYKSTDDPRPITEERFEAESAFEFLRNEVETETVGETIVTNVTLRTDIAEQISVGGVDVIPLGFYNAPAIGDDSPAFNYFNSNVFVGVRFDRFHISPLCEVVVRAELEFDLLSPPNSNLTYFIAVEKTDGRSPPNYGDQDADGNFINPPTARLASTPSTNLVEAVIPTDPEDNRITVEITQLVLDAIEGDWDAESIGFVLYTDQDDPVDRALIRKGSIRIRVSYVPSYKVNAQFRRAGVFQQGNPFEPYTSITPSQRKSSGMVYDSDLDLFVVFGGIDGQQVLGDLYIGLPRFGPFFGEEGEEDTEGNIGEQVDMRRFSTIRWTQRTPEPSPSPRWGHAMTYDEQNKLVILFGGFDENNQPMNDLWAYNVEDNFWVEIDTFMDNERPAPRGGAVLMFEGGPYYDRGDANYAFRARRRIALFGGTDGRQYFNDTWFYNYSVPLDTVDTDVPRRWILADPGGEFSTGPSPRAFSTLVYGQNFFQFYMDTEPPVRATPAGILFGGRTGALPTSPDTDGDLIPDGVEHALGGPELGRDPRVSRITQPEAEDERLPFNFVPIGTYPGKLTDLFPDRGLIADFEVLSYDERLPAWRNDRIFQGYPIESSWTDRHLVVGDETQFPIIEANTNRIVYNIGVASLIPDMTNLWYTRVRGREAGEVPNAWQLGRPDNLAIGPKGAPPYAYRGRWLYGTNLRGPYPNGEIMDLYSPIFDLEPITQDEIDGNFGESYYLIFHEWLDLADENDRVKVEVIRPSTGADVATRVSGTNRPPITILPERGYMDNTEGRWRRVVVPLDSVANESKLYLRFTLNSDASGNAGGWYIDKVAIVRAGRIEGVALDEFDNPVGPDVDVYLYGVNGDLLVGSTTTYGDGNFIFGLLPQGSYTWQVGMQEVDPDFFMTALGMNGNAAVSWQAIVGRDYMIEYTENLLDTHQVWTEMGNSPVTATNSLMSIVDNDATDAIRFYRVWRLP